MVNSVKEDNFQKPASPLPAHQPEPAPKVVETSSSKSQFEFHDSSNMANASFQSSLFNLEPTQPSSSSTRELSESSVTSEMNGVVHEENTSQATDIVPEQKSSLSSEKKDKSEVNETDKGQGDSSGQPENGSSPSDKINKKPKGPEPTKPEKRKRK